MDRYRRWPRWISFGACVLFLLLLGFIAVGATVFSERAHAAEDKPCWQKDDGLARAVYVARMTGSKMLVVPAPHMQEFIEALGDDGKDVTGEMAWDLLFSDGTTLILVQRGDQLCVAKTTTSWPDLSKLKPSTAKPNADETKPPDRDI